MKIIKEHKAILTLMFIILILNLFVVVNDIEFFRTAIIYFAMILMGMFGYIYWKEIT